MSKKDYYKILEIDKNADEETIKKAYRKKAKIYHPDKNMVVNDGISIYDITEAYSVLGDPNKKLEYDKSVSLEENNDFLWYLYVINLYIISFTTFLKKAIHETAKEKTPTTNKTKDLEIYMEVTLRDIYEKKIKKIVVKRHRNEQIEKKVLYISLYNYQDTYVFLNEGDAYQKDNNTIYGNICVKLTIREHESFVIDSVDKYDLWLETDLSLYEYYYGKSFTFFHLDDQEYTQSYDFRDQSDLVKRFHGKGLPFYDEENEIEMFGDLYIRFVLKLPKHHLLGLDRKEVKDILSVFL